MKSIKLSALLKSEGKSGDDIVKWAYYGYGFLSQKGECKVKEIPYTVKSSKCFSTELESYHYGEDGKMTAKTEKVYCVDGAL